MADTLREMILGFSVILGVLIVYVIALFLRLHKARTLRAHISGENPSSK